MPTILNPQTGTEQVVDDAVFRQMQRQMANDQADHIVRLVDNSEPTLRLWDCVDGSLSSPLPQSLALQHYLRKVVYKCSWCSFSSVFDGGVASHLAARRQQILNEEEPTVRTNDCQRQCATKATDEVVMYRFSLESSEPRVIATKRVLDGLEASQVERSQAPQKRKRRHRRHRRGRSNGASTD
jgi:hypothetical protein